MQTKKLTLLQCCPVCNSSWRGVSFYWMYKQADRQAVAECIKQIDEENAKAEHPLDAKALKKKYPKHTPDALIRHAASKHPYSNQSRVQQTEDGKYLVCPECHSAFPIGAFKDAGLLKSKPSNNE